jgi:two-component system phosphate regulon sensor histidine kinase PhoR
MRSRSGMWSTASRRLVALFLLVLVPPAVALAALGLLVLEQDRRLIAERDRERAAAAADAVVRSLADAVAQARNALRAGDEVPGAALLRLDGEHVVARPAALLLWTPTPRPLQEAETTAFVEAERNEFQRRGDRGRAVYERLSRSPAAPTQAGALLRLARLHRNEGRPEAALEAYADLARITDVAFDGMPADLLARRACCDLLERARRTDVLATCAQAVGRDLLAGRWSLDHASWQLSADQIVRWTSTPLDVGPDRRAISEAADWFWREGRRADRASDAGRRWHLVDTKDGSVTLEWAWESTTLTALVVTPDALTRWARAARLGTQKPDTNVAITTTDGTPIAGTPPPKSAPATFVTRTSTESGLPWDVRLWTQANGATPEADTRRLTLAAGLVALLLLVGGGGFLIWRVVQRELAIAALQTDFVATVSHEFRTPLASLRHVADLLDEDDDLPGDRRRALYGVINRNAKRLSGLVDTLLHFARMESGRQPYALQPLDAGELARAIVDEFVRHVDDDHVQVSSHVADGDLTIDADADALGRALSNLLDNAAKYGPRPCHIDVSVMRAGRHVQFAVRDDGPGVPSNERPHLFDKFVRGEDATRRGIRGTGLGLAIVSHVTRAHGGTVTVESEPEHGSTFRITVPASNAAAALAATANREPHAAVDAGRGETTR